MSLMKHYSLLNFNTKISIELFINSNIKNPRDEDGCAAHIYVWVGLSVDTRPPDHMKSDIWCTHFPRSYLKTGFLLFSKK